MEKRKATKKIKDLTQYYRWQFLRLNDDYRADYQMYAQALGNADGNLPPERFQEMRVHFLRKYGINGIYDHVKKKPPEGLIIYGEADNPAQIGNLASVYPDIYANVKSDYGFINNHKFIEKKAIKVERKREPSNKKMGFHGGVSSALAVKSIELVVNVDAKIDDIKNSVIKIVKPYQNLKIKRQVVNRSRDSNSHSPKVYDEYLRVYELRRKGMRNKDIAKEIFPNHENRSRGSNANKQWKSALELIGGGYKRIVF